MAKSPDMVVFQNWINILSNLLTAIKKLGGNADAFKNFNNQNIIDEVARILVGKKNDLKLKFLSVVNNAIVVATPAFNKSLFSSSNVPKYYIWDNFQKWILNKASEIIPEFKGTLKSLKISKSMDDPNILAEISEANVFSINEVCAIVKALTERQSNGEVGNLLSDGCANILYVRLTDNCVVPACVYRDSVSRRWFLNTFRFDGGTWGGGHCVFVRG